MDWRMELSVKAKYQNLISYVLLKNSSEQACPQRGFIYIKAHHFKKPIK
jgi:hypothetical protein